MKKFLDLITDRGPLFILSIFIAAILVAPFIWLIFSMLGDLNKTLDPNMNWINGVLAIEWLNGDIDFIEVAARPRETGAGLLGGTNSTLVVRPVGEQVLRISLNSIRSWTHTPGKWVEAFCEGYKTGGSFTLSVALQGSISFGKCQGQK